VHCGEVSCTSNNSRIKEAINNNMIWLVCWTTNYTLITPNTSDVTSGNDKVKLCLSAPLTAYPSRRSTECTIGYTLYTEILTWIPSGAWRCICVLFMFLLLLQESDPSFKHRRKKIRYHQGRKLGWIQSRPEYCEKNSPSPVVQPTEQSLYWLSYQAHWWKYIQRCSQENAWGNQTQIREQH
jgi:hypothetical protein